MKLVPCLLFKRPEDWLDEASPQNDALGLAGFVDAAILQWRDPTGPGGLPCPLAASFGASKRPTILVASPGSCAIRGYSLRVHPCQTPADALRQLFRTFEMDIERVYSRNPDA